MKKRFLCVWTGPTYQEAINIYNEREKFFAENHGFGADDIFMVNNLEVGQHYSCEQGMHVIRLNDETDQ